ncbi:MAG: DUF2207 domain-containing protein [Pseudomonadota bacterium]
MRVVLTFLLSLLWAGVALAQERITNYSVDIQVEATGDIQITEVINVVAEGDQIRRGIFRELPAYFTFEGVRQSFDYDLISVTRDGQPETVTVLREGNGITWRLGRADVFLTPGPYEYRIEYRVPNVIQRHDDKDELYWNPIGPYSLFPIENVDVTIRFPDGASVVDNTLYTGRFGSTREDANITAEGSVVRVTTTQTLPPQSGITISTSIAKGTINPLTERQKVHLFWLRFGGIILLMVGGLGLTGYYLFAWNRVGRDPVKRPVFARYEPPKTKSGEPYSPAAAHYIHHKGFRGMDALSSLLMQLGTESVLDIEANKKRTTIRQVGPVPRQRDAKTLLDEIMPRSGMLDLDGGTDTAFHKGVAAFHRTIAKRYGPTYYKRNLVWALLGIVVSLALAITVIAAPVAKNSVVVIGLFIALGLLNLLFAFLLPAPTERGADVSAELEGFKLYLETAEEKRLNMADPVSGRAPAMTVELYERFLPYAMALGVEKPWTKQFKTSLPREAKDYQPSYAYGDALTGRGGPVGFSRGLSKTLTAGVAAAAPVSQSSGSGGGGFSGGGGGGGGVGGW